MSLISRSAATALCAVAALLLSTTSPGAAPEHVDVLVQSGCADLCVGAFDFVALEVLAEQRSFPVVLDEENQNGEVVRYETQAPGFVSRSQGLPPGWGPLPGGSALFYFFLSDSLLGRNLSFWDGLPGDGLGPVTSGDVDFGPVPDDEVFVGQIEAGFLEFELSVADGADEDVGGSRVATIGEAGGLHNHVSFFLYGDDTPVVSPGEPAADLATPGVYLVTLGVEVAAPGAGAPERSAPPAYALFAAGDVDPGALDAATEWVDTVLVPEPSVPAGIAAALATLAALRGRRRRRAARLAGLIGLAGLAASPTARAERLLYTEGHSDIEVALVDEDGAPGFEALASFFRAEGAVIAGEFVVGPSDFSAEQIEIDVPDSTRETLTQVQIDFFGLEPVGVGADEPVWILPQDQIAADTREAPFLGLAATEIEAGLVEDDRIRLQLVEMQAPQGGEFSAWQSTFEPPTPFAISTVDGIDEDDFFSMGARSHAHYNLAFTREGAYELTFEPRGTLTGSGAAVTGSVTYRFAVPEPQPGAAGLAVLAALWMLAARRPRVVPPRRER